MNARNLAGEWDEAARHLVRAHGADADRLLSLGPTLSQLNWVHFDTHAALEIAGWQPPARHVHRDLPDPSDPSDGPDRFKPFRSAPSSLTLPPTTWADSCIDYHHTGLPQTGMFPWNGSYVITGDWASMAAEELGKYFAAGCPQKSHVSYSPTALAVGEHFAARGRRDVSAGQAVAEFRGLIRRHAEAVALRFQVKSGFPAVRALPDPQRPFSARTEQQSIPRQTRRR
jgi:hypothetical protein